MLFAHKCLEGENRREIVRNYLLSESQFHASGKVMEHLGVWITLINPPPKLGTVIFFFFWGGGRLRKLERWELPFDAT